MSKIEIRGKHDEDATQLLRRSHPASHPYKEGPPDRANRAPRKMHERIRIRIHVLASMQRIRSNG